MYLIFGAALLLAALFFIHPLLAWAAWLGLSLVCLRACLRAHQELQDHATNH